MPTSSERQTILAANRARKMARSAHAYVRGNTAKFYEWLDASSAASGVPSGPSVWICGDCHLGNLGPLANGDGKVEIQIRDLDQAVIGNPAYDLIRLGLSLATAARGSDLPGVTTAKMIEQMVEGYASAMRHPTGGHAGVEPDVVRAVKRDALGRRWRHLAKERLEDVDPKIPLGRKFWALEPDELVALKGVFTDPGVSQLILSLDHKSMARAVELVDAAYWMKGCSSLGLLRLAAITRLRNAKGRSDYALIDLKEATAPVAPADATRTMPIDHGTRVVAAAKALSPHLGARMTSAKMLGRSVFIRELAPQDLKLEVEQFTQSQAVTAARYLAFIIGKAHGRQMESHIRNEWLAILQSDRQGSIDAPSWLWRSVVSLSGSHEIGYLEHCRTYAMAM